MLQGDYGLKIKDDARVMKEGLEARPYFIFGHMKENALFERFRGALPAGLKVEKDSFLLDGKRYDMSDSVLVAAFRAVPKAGNAETKAPVVCIFFGGLDASEMEQIARRMPHLTGKGYLIFSRGGGLEYGSFEGEKSLRYEFGQ